jgi:hypothetical protein
MGRFVSFSILTILGGALAFITGCGGGGSGPEGLSTEQKHIHHAVQLINEYSQATKKQPTSIDEVKDWAVKEGKGAADDFTSTRDKEPYGLVAGPGPLVVYEQTGKGGKCYIFRMGQVSEIKKDEVQNAIKTAQSMGRPAGTKMGERKGGKTESNGKTESK